MKEDTCFSIAKDLASLLLEMAVSGSAICIGVSYIYTNSIRSFESAVIALLIAITLRVYK